MWTIGTGHDLRETIDAGIHMHMHLRRPALTSDVFMSSPLRTQLYMCVCVYTYLRVQSVCVPMLPGSRTGLRSYNRQANKHSEQHVGQVSWVSDPTSIM